MRTYSTDKALEIAQRNATKAICSGYIAIQDANDPVAWDVIKPNGQKYRVHLHFNSADHTEYRGYCGCKFSGDGFTNWTCKHIEICREIVDTEYYREVDQIIAKTVRRIREEEELLDEEEFHDPFDGPVPTGPVYTGRKVTRNGTTPNYTRRIVPVPPYRDRMTEFTGDPSLYKMFA
jgi:hypothetical protein